jgi:hypothetical protein
MNDEDINLDELEPWRVKYPELAKEEDEFKKMCNSGEYDYGLISFDHPELTFTLMLVWLTCVMILCTAFI